MAAIYATARFAGGVRAGGPAAVATTVTRSEAEEALRASDGPVELILEVSRAQGEAARTVDVAWEPLDLERLLEETQGAEELTLTFDAQELEQLLEQPDFEAHGLREKALVLTVAATTAAGVAGAAWAQPVVDAGGTGQAAAVQQISDAASGGPLVVTPSDAVQQISDAASGGPLGVTPSDAVQPISDAASGGPGEPVAPQAGGGFSLSTGEDAAIAAGGLALLITAAGFAAAKTQGRRTEPGVRPA